MSTEISATYLGRCGNKHWKSRRIYVALGHDELNKPVVVGKWLRHLIGLITFVNELDIQKRIDS